jgi:hypothetical protein
MAAIMVAILAVIFNMVAKTQKLLPEPDTLLRILLLLNHHKALFLWFCSVEQLVCGVAY